MTQAELAEHMTAIGHGWVQATVSEVERGGRGVSAHELAGLALCLNTCPLDLLRLPAWPPSASSGADGVWVSYYSDWSGFAVHATEIDALRAVANHTGGGDSVMFLPYGADPYDVARRQYDRPDRPQEESNDG